MATSLSNWQPYENKIDDSSKRGEGRFLSGAFTMIAAGPPRLDAIARGSLTLDTLASNLSGGASPLPNPAMNFAVPIGLVQNFSLGQNKSFARFFELGSERSYFIAGRTTAQASFSRVMYNGPSLLRMMYAFYLDTLAPTIVPAFGINAVYLNSMSNKHDVKIPPGYENMYLNLASDLFSQPCGLLVYLKDSNETTASAMYLEETYIPSHQISTDAQGVVIQEMVQLQPERTVPVGVTALTIADSISSVLMNTAP